jgi:hypothetical protein
MPKWNGRAAPKKVVRQTLRRKFPALENHFPRLKNHFQNLFPNGKTFGNISHALSSDGKNYQKVFPTFGLRGARLGNQEKTLRNDFATLAFEFPTLKTS